MNKLQELKKQKTIYISLLEEEKITESIKYFEKYLHNLRTFQDLTEENKQLIVDEINKSKQEFIQKVDNLGNNYLKDKKYTKGAICFAEVIQHAEKNYHILMRYIICLHNLKQYDLEEEFLKKLETIISKEKEPDILKELSKFYSQLEKKELAILFLEKYINQIPPEKIEAEDYTLLGMYYNEVYLSRKERNIEEAYKSLDYTLKAVKLDPSTNNISAITISSMLVNDNQLTKTYWKKLLETQQIEEKDLLEYAQFCMKIEDFNEFYKYHYLRTKVEHLAFKYQKINKPIWNGEDISDKTLLIYWEQGFGDTIFVCGYINKLSKFAKNIIFVVQNSLAPLLEIQNFNVKILPIRDVNLDEIDFDYYIYSMSIFELLKLDREEFRTPFGYIKADKILSEIYRKKYFNNNKIKIGIAYQGHKEGNKSRNLDLEKFLPFDKIDGIEIYSFDMTTKEKEYEIFKNNKINILKPLLINFSDTAAMIENCDIIITTDNVILNLAGAMGKKTYGLFNWHYEFRWFGLKENDTVFYSSVTPIINSEIDKWDKSIQKVTEEIKELVKQRKKKFADCDKH